MTAGASRWTGNWSARLRNRLNAVGFESVLDFARAHPGVTLFELTRALGDGFAPVQLRDHLRGSVATPTDAEWLGRDLLVRDICTWFANGWRSGSEEADFEAAAALASWRTGVAGVLPPELVETVAEWLWQRREDLAGWLPIGPDDPVILGLFKDEGASE